jgi:hypothetical protein
MARTTVRLQLEFPDRIVKVVEDLMSLAGLRTKKEFFNNALTLFKWAIEERRAGRQIASLDGAQGLYRELHMPALDSAAPTVSSAAVTDGQCSSDLGLFH